MSQDNVPSLNRYGLFVQNAHSDKIQNFHKSVIGNEGALCLCDLADFGQIYEHSGKLVAVDPPEFDVQGVFHTPGILQLVQSSQKFESTAEVMAAMKEMFADVLQQVMESELEENLGYEKSERVAEDSENSVSKNYRNGYSEKRVKTQLGEVDLRIPRDRKGEYEPGIVGKYDRNADGMEEKIIGLYACGLSQRDIAEQIKAL